METNFVQNESKKPDTLVSPSGTLGLLLGGLLAGSTILLAGGCNTVEGAGQDVEAAGSEIEETAEEVSD